MYLLFFQVLQHISILGNLAKMIPAIAHVTKNNPWSGIDEINIFSFYQYLLFLLIHNVNILKIELVVLILASKFSDTSDKSPMI